MRLMLYKRQWLKLGFFSAILVSLIYLFKLEHSSSIGFGELAAESDNIYPGLSAKKTYNGNSQNILFNNNQDLDSIKRNLIIMRKYLQASVSLTNSNSDKNNQSDLALSVDESERGKQILKDNAKTFIEIAELLEKNGYDRGQAATNRAANSQDKPEPSLQQSSKKDRQIMKIHEWEPFYVDFDNTISLEEKRLQYLKDKIEDWELFFINFPNEKTQDDILFHFKLPDAMLKELENGVHKYEQTRKPVHVPEPKRLNVYQSQHLQSWQQFHQHITQYQLYSPDDPLLKQVIKELQTMPFTKNYQPDGGTQQKVIFVMQNGLRVIFKPMRFPRKQEALPDHMFWRDFERHFAEIAAFHLDMVLGFYRVPPVVGRYVNVTSEVEQLDTKGELTVFTSPAGNRCFYGKCDYYCDTAHAVCGRPDILEGSIMMYLPTTRFADRVNWENPWKRTYSKTKPRAKWQEYYNYCDAIKKQSPYDSGRSLVDLMDTTVFDFLSGNMDRHHYETIEEFGNFTSPVLFDNGRGFGKFKHDELTILAPLYQCCLVRYSTLKKLLAFHKGPTHLSDAMRDSLAKDLAKPILLEPHLEALDRRLAMILRTVHKCISQHGYSNVVKDDGF